MEIMKGVVITQKADLAIYMSWLIYHISEGILPKQRKKKLVNHTTFHIIYKYICCENTHQYSTFICTTISASLRHCVLLRYYVLPCLI